MTDEQLLLLWGKTDRDNPGSTRYHPLLFHLLDVGHVAQALWDHSLPARMKKRIAASLGLTLDEARIAVAILAGLHDLGKAYPAFQRQCERLFRQLGLPDALTEIRHKHGFVSAKELASLLEDGSVRWTNGKNAAWCLAGIAGGHHGVFPNSGDLNSIRAPSLGGDEWQLARKHVIERFLDLILPADFTRTATTIQDLREPFSVPLLAGLISVADWIGSSADHFPLCDPKHFPPEQKYATLSRKQAAKALRAFGWLPGATPAELAGMDRAFHYLAEKAGRESFMPNRAQKVVAEFAEAGEWPYLIVAEEAMGRGKTEAALYAFDRAFCAGDSRGLYVALPTQATGNAMFRRVGEYLAERGHSGNLQMQLVHGNALLNEQFRDLMATPIYDESVSGGTVAAASWFTERKRPLLAPFGVGTIDQSLMGVLQTRHWFVRLFGLAGKTIVFDEIHAYDVYMLEELKRLVTWLRELDCSVVLLSATLPSGKRRELVEAWRAGAQNALESVEFPRVTFVSQTQSKCVHVGEPSEIDRDVSLEFASVDCIGLPGLVFRSLPSGGMGVIICNTVDRSQEVYRTIKGPLEREGWKVLLFHARMPLKWREARETEVLNRLGKGGDRSQKIIVVGTSVLEQSLDYDVDWMCSDMAPVDLLIQRMGRLWRHMADYPRGTRPVPRPVFCLLSDGQPGEGPPPKFEESGFYARYVLLRTWLAVRGLPKIALPADIEDLVEMVYTSDPPSGLDPDWAEELATSKKAQCDDERESRKKVTRILLREPVAPEDLLESFCAELEEDDDPEVHWSVRAATRDAEPSVQVICSGTDENGISLAPSPANAPNSDEARELLRFGLTLQHKGLYHSLIREDVPDCWTKSAHLRYHRLLTFVQGKTSVGDVSLRINKNEGLVIVRKEDS